MALAAASRAGDLDNLCVLLKAGADPNARDKRGKTALHEACSRGHDKCVEALLRAGALVSAHKTNGFTPLHYAAATGRASIISILLASFGFSGANACDRDHKGEQAIHLAARGGFVPAVEILLAHGASGNAASNNGRTRLAVFIRRLSMDTNLFCGFFYRPELIRQPATLEALNPFTMLLPVATSVAWSS